MNRISVDICFFNIVLARIFSVIPVSQVAYVILSGFFEGADPYLRRMKRFMASSLLVFILVVTGFAGGMVLAGQGTGVNTGKQPGITGHQLAFLSSKRVKISPEQAVNIALNVHKHSKVLSVRLQQSLYIVHLKTFMGKRTLKIGANSGKIFYDKLDWLP